MKAKFASGVTPFRGKYQGGVYQSFSAGNQILSNKRNSRSRYPNQFLTAAIMAKVTRAWAFLTPGERSNWNGWAATYPQPCRYRSGCYLTGYQNFLQRNFYELLFFGINAPLITSPVLSVVANSEVTPTLTRSGANLLLNYSWSRSGGDIWAGVFVSHIVSGGKLYNLNYPRFVGVIDNGGGLVVKYGVIYNWWAAFNSANITALGWHVINYSEIQAIWAANGGVSVCGGKWKSKGLDYWQSPNTGATNSFGTNGRGGGYREQNGSFTNLKIFQRVWSYYNPNPSYYRYFQTGHYSLQSQGYSNTYANRGYSLVFVKDSNPISNGSVGSYTGNDGKHYSTVGLAGFEITSLPICESKFRNGSSVPLVELSSAWAALSSPGMCYYGNDISNAFSSGSTSADISEGWGRNFGVLPNVGDYLILRFVKVGKANGQFLGVEQYTIPIT